MEIFSTVLTIILTLADFTSSLDTNSIERAVNTKVKKLVNPYNYKFIVETTPCSAKDDLLIVVHTSPKVCPCINLLSVCLLAYL